MAERRVSTDFGLMFYPERWSWATKFRSFMGPPYEVTKDLKKGVEAAQSHFAKYSILGGLANRLRDELLQDEAEFEEKGHTPAKHSKEYAALAETLFCELYSSLDGIRRTLYAAYGSVRGVQNKSTERLFVRAKENKYGEDFPEDIRLALVAAHDAWFPRLRRIRTELTHGETGHCHLSKESGKIVYLHVGLGSAKRAFVIEDLVDELNTLAIGVDRVIEEVFAALCAKLEPTPKRVICGIYKGLCYERSVSYSSTLSFNDGRCTSVKWFASKPGCECPIRAKCGAYQRAVEDQTVASTG